MDPVPERAQRFVRDAAAGAGGRNRRDGPRALRLHRPVRLGDRAMKRLAVIVAFAFVGALVFSSAPATTLGAAPLEGRILFTRCDDAHGCQIYTANPDGSAIRRVTGGGESFEGDWSPDGTRIAYISLRSGDFAVWIANADGSHAMQLTKNDRDSDDFWPRFAPGGRRILFANCLGQDCDG